MEENKRIPTHIALQMDGNRRWGKQHTGTESDGHKEGVKTLKKICEHCRDMGVKIFTVYALSRDNLNKRSKEELAVHFGLHKKYIREEILNSNEFINKRIKFKVLGRTEELPKDEQKLIKQAEEKTKKFTDFQFNVCLCYNGKDEIVDAVKKIIEQGYKPENITQNLIKQNLYTKDIPPPDMIIKTGMNPEQRISDFLLFDCGYSELFFTSTYWPAFTTKELDKMIDNYNHRQRRFGE